MAADEREHTDGDDDGMFMTGLFGPIDDAELLGYSQEGIALRLATASWLRSGSVIRATGPATDPPELDWKETGTAA
jgi:hypothetical protein